MSVQRIQHTENNKSKLPYYFAAAGTALSTGIEAHKTRSAIKSEITVFKMTLDYLYKNPLNDRETGFIITPKMLKPEIKNLKDKHRALIKDIKKTFPKRLVLNTVLGAAVGFLTGKIISMIFEK